MRWFDGSEFVGEWKLDMRHKGRMRMSDGSIYEGDFLNDCYHGLGKIMTKMNGRAADGSNIYKIFEGVFEHGRTPNEGKIYYSDLSKGLYFGEH
jgi:hypothetical protein